jgi:4-amino-4-deoxy-L-arabinose transferase-like glycosyltransferase
MGKKSGESLLGKLLEDNRALIFILLVSLVIRVVFSVDNVKSLFIDIKSYEDDAIAILDAGIMSLKAYHAPVYPFFIAAVYAVFGRSYLYVYIAQSVLGTLTTFMIYLIAGRLGAGKRISLLSAGASLLYWPLQMYSGILLSETVFLFLLSLGVYIFLKALDMQKLLLFAAAGVVFGLSTLTRSINMLLLFVLPVVYFLYYRTNLKKLFINSLMYILAFIAVISPWAIRNYIIYKEFIPVDTLGGINLYIGNNERSSGFFVSLSQEELKEAVQKYTKKGRQGENVAVNDKNLREAALTYIKAHPFRFIRLTLWRASLFLMLDFRDVDWVLLTYMSKHFVFHHTLWKAVIYFSDILFFLLAITGISLLLKMRNGLLLFGFILYYWGLTSLFYISERYRLPVMPFLSISAAFAIDRLIRKIKKSYVYKKRRYT